MNEKGVPVLCIEVDAAASMSEMKMGKRTINFPPTNKQYKLVGFFPIGENGQIFPMCSKDGKKWSICCGAEKDGEPVDLLYIKTVVEEKARHWRKT